MSKKKDPALLTKEQIRKFKEKEQEAKNFYGFLELAEFVAKAGDKDWARKIYKKAEELAENTEDYQELAESIANEDYLGDKDLARKIYKKAEELAENSVDYQELAESIANEDYLGDKDLARKIYKKAEELAENSVDYKYLAESIANEDYLGDKEWAQDILPSRKYDEWEISEVKFLDNSLPVAGVGSRCKIKPVNDYKKIIEYFNSVYSDDDYDSLFNYKVYDEVIVLWGTTYLLRFNGEELGIDDIFDITEREFIKKLMENNVPEVLHKLIFWGDGQIGVSEIVEKILMKPGTKAVLDITDQKYGNSKVDLEA